MFRIISLCLFLLSVTTVFSQNNSIKIGFGAGQAPYEGKAGPHYSLEFERTLGLGMSVFLSGGIMHYDFTLTGRSQGNSGGETWDNSYSYEHVEQFHYADLGLKAKLFGVGERYACQLALGVSAGRNVYQYPDPIVIKKGIIVTQVDVRHKNDVVLFLGGLHQQFNITPRFCVGLNASFRTTFKTVRVREVVATDDSGKSTSTSGIRNIPCIALMAGYRF